MSSLNALSLKTKLALAGAGLVVLLSVSVLLLLERQVTPRLEAQLIRHGVVIARGLSDQLLEPALRQDLFGLQEVIQDTLRLNPEVRYAFVTNSSGRVLAHSFAGGFPQDLYSLPHPAPGQGYLATVLSTEDGLIRDIAIPLYPGKTGTVHVGMSERFIEQVIASTRKWVLLTAGSLLLLGLVIAYLMASLITRPLKRLVEITRAVGRGDFQQRAAGGQDEIGELGSAFNIMTGELELSRQELHRRHLGLSALSVAAAVVVTSDDLGEALRQVLKGVVDVMGAKAGWILQRGTATGKLELAAYHGLPADLAGGQVALDPAECGDTHLLDTSEPIVGQGIPACPPALQEAAGRAGLGYYATIPLRSRTGVLGIMTLGSDGSRQFTPYELELMTSIGRLVGLAIENAHLWREVRQREEMRRQLLAWFIAAHEEERRRFARELHDGASQDLAAMLLGLKLIGSAPTLLQARERAAEVYELTQQTFSNVGQLSKDLRPSALDDLGLVPALQSYLDRYTQRHGIPVELYTRGMEARLHPRVETVLYRAIQTALTHVAKHGPAGALTVTLERDGAVVSAVISQGGTGLDPGGAPQGQEIDLALQGVRETLSFLGGRMEVQAGQGRGSRLVITVPPSL